MQPRQDDEARHAFSAQLVKAITELESRASTVSQSDLASRAIGKLQYDFPLLTIEELQAIAQCLRDALQSKSGWFPFRLSREFINNITAGARRLPHPNGSSAASSTPQPAAPTLPSEPIPASSTPTPLTSSNEQQEPQAVLAAYQQLCAVVFIQLVQHLLALPEQAAWQVLSHLHTSDPDPQEEDAAAQPLDLQTQQQIDAFRAQPGVVVYDDTEAEISDDDCFVFEDLMPAPAASALHQLTHRPGAMAGSTASCGPNSIASPADLPPYSWQQLQCKLLDLTRLVQYSLVDEPAIWEGPAAADSVLQLLRTLAAHRHAAELEPLTHVYVILLCDHMAQQPSALPILSQLWDAIGVSSIVTMPRTKRQSTSPPMPAEAMTCFSVIATLANQLQSPGPRSKLWYQVHSHLIPLAERCLQDLSRQDLGPEMLAAVILICQVLHFYLEQRPANIKVGQELIDKGIMAPLAVVFSTCSSQLPAEPLRTVVLCCAASSSQVHQWLTAVPCVKKTLAADFYQPGGLAESDGDIWELLGNEHGPRMLKMLSSGTSAGDIGRLHTLLTLLGKVVACADRRVLWADSVGQGMRALYAELRKELSDSAKVTEAMSGSENGLTPKAGYGAELPPEAEQVPSNSVGDAQSGLDLDEVLHKRVEAKELQLRLSNKLQPACLKLLKGLLTDGGKTD